MSPRFLIFVAVFNSILGLSVLFPVLPPLGRELGLSEFEVGSLSAAYSFMQFAVSPAWGRRSERVGRKPVLLTGILGFSLSFFAFYAVAHFGLKGLLSPALIYGLLLLTRLAGGALSSATLPTAHAFIADTTDRKTRTSGMALMGAAFGLGIVFEAGYWWFPGTHQPVGTGCVFSRLRAPQRDVRRVLSSGASEEENGTSGSAPHSNFTTFLAAAFRWFGGKPGFCGDGTDDRFYLPRSVVFGGQRDRIDGWLGALFLRRRGGRRAGRDSSQDLHSSHQSGPDRRASGVGRICTSDLCFNLWVTHLCAEPSGLGSWFAFARGKCWLVPRGWR